MLAADQLKRQSASDAFYSMCRKIIPRMEERVETQLMTKFMDKLSSPEEKREVEIAYMQRKDKLAKLYADVMPVKMEDFNKDKIQDSGFIDLIIRSKNGRGFRHHNFEDIGTYTLIPHQHFDRVFPGKEKFGRLYEMDYKLTNTWGLMTREEGLKITNDLSRLRLPKDREVPYERILKLSNQETKTDFIQEPYWYA